MPLYGPVYAGINKMAKNTRWAKKPVAAAAAPVTRKSSVKPATRKNNVKPASSKKTPKSNASTKNNTGACGNAGRRLVGCRGRVLTRTMTRKCKSAGTNLIKCRWN